MARFQTDTDARRLGEALAALRRARGLSQAEAGARLGMTSQGWGLYEAGKRPGLFRPDVQRRLTSALDATPDALQPPQTETPGVRSEGAPWIGPPAVPRRQLQLSNDDLAPWASSGVVLEYVPDRWPRRDQGCVIELTDGRLVARLYEGADGEVLILRGGPGGLAREARLARAMTRAVSAVVARLEPG